MDKKYLQGYACLQDDFDDLPEQVELSPSDILCDGIERDSFEQAIIDYLRDEFGTNLNGYNVKIIVSDIDWNKEE